jgi:methylated-DNA-protein-cysteine methyltransferase-like protein
VTARRGRTRKAQRPARSRTRRARGKASASAAAKLRASETNYARIWRVVARIPRGRVTTYGQVAELAGLPRAARQVGYAMHALPAGSRVPWQRVVNAAGAVSPRAAPGAEDVQRLVLEREGVRFDTRGRIDLARYGWRPGLGAARPRR